MLIHERFVFLHLQKTAGTTLAQGLRSELQPGSVSSGAPDKLHPGWSDIPDKARGLPVLLYVRNPWDWYVSWYHFVLKRRPKNPIFRHWFADGANDFATTIRNACSSVAAHREDPYVRDLIARGNRGVELMARGHDYYSARFLDSAGAGLDSDLLTIGRFESLYDDLERFLQDAGVELSADSAARLRATERLQVTPHKPYSEYYDDELQELVGSSCRLFVERFGYRFEAQT